jgi:hypothetical protein
MGDLFQTGGLVNSFRCCVLYVTIQVWPVAHHTPNQTQRARRRYAQPRLGASVAVAENV